MNRRGLLTAVGTGLASGLAGCGYAYGAGEVVDEERVRSLGTQTKAFATTGDRKLYVNSPSVFDEGDRSLYLVDRQGTRRQQDTYGAPIEAVALAPSATTAYLLAASTGRPDEEEATGVATVDLTVDEGNHPYTRIDGIVSGEDVPDGSPRSGGGGALAATDAGAYCLLEDGVAAVGDGEERWRRNLDAPTTVAADEQVIVATETGLRAFEDDGSEQWHVGTTDSPSIATDGDRTAVHADDELRLLDASGEDRWTTDLPSGGTQLRFDDDWLLVEWRNSVAVVDGDDGTVRLDRSRRVSTPAVWDGDRAYGVRDCGLVAVDDEGELWRRPFDLNRCSAIDGWIDGDQVTILFRSGDLLWFSRTEEEPGLPW